MEIKKKKMWGQPPSAVLSGVEGLSAGRSPARNRRHALFRVSARANVKLTASVLSFDTPLVRSPHPFPRGVHR
jgi:hypothetical protein